jgi:hypothetical protein
MEERGEESSKNDDNDVLGAYRNLIQKGHRKKRKYSSSGECEPSPPPSIDPNTTSKPSTAEPEFSSSVSFWWGRRILKK